MTRFNSPKLSSISWVHPLLVNLTTLVQFSLAVQATLAQTQVDLATCSFSQLTLLTLANFPKLTWQALGQPLRVDVANLGQLPQADLATFVQLPLADRTNLSLFAD